MKPHISATQLEMAARCLEQYRRRYVCKEIIPPGIALLVGGAVHEGIEVNMRQKIETHADLRAVDVIDAAAAAFDRRADEDGLVLTPEEESRGRDIVLGEALDTTTMLAGLHAEEQAPDYQPVAVEHNVRIELPTTHDLLTITDLIDDKDRVVDFKTANRRKQESEVHQSTQLTIYAAAFACERTRLPSEVRLDVLVKNKKPVRQVLSSTRGQADFVALVNRVNASVNVINVLSSAGVEAWPAAPLGSWWCSPKFCGYWNTCPHVNSERMAAAESKE